jgi:hypothetical protein
LTGITFRSAWIAWRARWDTPHTRTALAFGKNIGLLIALAWAASSGMGR